VKANDPKIVSSLWNIKIDIKKLINRFILQSLRYQETETIMLNIYI
jgi:hypothetical protein